MNSHSFNVLVVENERIIAWDLSERIKRLGHNVCATAATGEDAVRLASEFLPSVVLMDIMLDGEMDGIEAAQEIRSCLDLPVIFCSACSKEKQALAQTARPLGFIEKPINTEILKQLLAKLDNNRTEGY